MQNQNVPLINLLAGARVLLCIYKHLHRTLKCGLHPYVRAGGMLNDETIQRSDVGGICNVSLLKSGQITPTKYIVKSVIIKSAIRIGGARH